MPDASRKAPVPGRTPRPRPSLRFFSKPDADAKTHAPVVYIRPRFSTQHTDGFVVDLGEAFQARSSIDGAAQQSRFATLVAYGTT